MGYVFAMPLLRPDENWVRFARSSCKLGTSCIIYKHNLNLTDKLEAGIIYIEAERRKAEMFGKKKNNNKFNENEIVYKELCNDIAKHSVELREQVRDVEIKTKVIPLYPECYEKFEATTELEMAKIKLHGKINAYTKAVEDAKKFYKTHEHDIHFPAYQTPSVTKIIEIAYRNIYKIYM